MLWLSRSSDSWSAGEDGDAARVEFLRIRFVFAPGEDIDFVRQDNFRETGLRQHLAPLCFQQSTGNSAAPEFDVALRLLRHFDMDEDVAHLDAPAGLEYTEHLAKDGWLIGAEVDHAVADDNVGDAIRDG